MKRRTGELQFQLPNVPEIPAWVLRSIERRIKKGNLTIVSAVCPDYERINGRFTYKSVGCGVPYVAGQHLQVVKSLISQIPESVQVTYSVTLADTEFDLPLVMDHLVGGDPCEFLRRCQASCENIFRLAQAQGLPIKSSNRFTKIFPKWFEFYNLALQGFRFEAETNSSTSFDLAANANSRSSLYFAMTGGVNEGDPEYCREMVLRQWAQYAAWGEAAREVFGQDLIMINHSTPNLGRVNDQLFRRDRERIPILQLSTTTTPG